MKNEDNNKKWEWLIEQFSKPRTYIILLFISLLIPLGINCLYKLGDKCPSPILTKWNAADTLSFYGNYLSFLGTVILGAVTVYQTKKAHKQTEKANQLAEQMQKLEQAHFVSMVSLFFFRKYKIAGNVVEIGNVDELLMNAPVAEIDFTDDGVDKTKKYVIDIMLKNNSDFPIVKMKSHLELVNQANTTIEGVKERKVRFDIAPQGEQNVRFIFPQSPFCYQKNCPIKIDIKFANAFGYVTPTNLYIDDLNAINNFYSFTTEELTTADITEII